MNLSFKVTKKSAATETSYLYGLDGSYFRVDENSKNFTETSCPLEISVEDKIALQVKV